MNQTHTAPPAPPAPRAPAAVPEEDLVWLRDQVLALCEDTEERYAKIAERDLEGKPGAYARGRVVEAKSIRRAIAEVVRCRLAARTLAAAPAAPPVDGGTAEDRDDVLFAFHRYVDNPTPFEVTWWTRHFPQFAQDIREHAVEVIDMNFRAANPNPDWAEQVARRVCDEHDVGSATFDVAEALRNAEATGYTRGCTTRPISRAPIASFIARDCACCSDQPTVPPDCPACHGTGGFTRYQIANGMIAKVPPTLSSRTPAGAAGDPVGDDEANEAVARALYEHDNRNLRNVWRWDQDGLDAEHPGVRDGYLRRAAVARRASLAIRPASPAPAASAGGEEALWDAVHEAAICAWNLLDGTQDDASGVNQADWDALSAAMNAMAALVPEEEQPFSPSYAVAYLRKLAAAAPAAPPADGGTDGLTFESECQRIEDEAHAKVDHFNARGMRAEAMTCQGVALGASKCRRAFAALSSRTPAGAAGDPVENARFVSGYLNDMALRGERPSVVEPRTTLPPVPDGHTMEVKTALASARPASPAPAASEGGDSEFVLVPREATPEQYGAGGVAQFKNDMACTPVREAVGNVYRAMVARGAALAPAAQVNPGREEIARIILAKRDALLGPANDHGTIGGIPGAWRRSELCDQFADAILAARPVAENDAGETR